MRGYRLRESKHLRGAVRRTRCTASLGATISIIANWRAGTTSAPIFASVVGQTLLLTGAASPRRAAPTVGHSRRSNTRRRRRIPQTRQMPQAGAAAIATGQKWVWPTERSGRAASRCPAAAFSWRGMWAKIFARHARAGWFTPAADMRGYGNLIIIKHGENLLSAYAHNRDSLVRDGEEVAVGQVDRTHGRGCAAKAGAVFRDRRRFGKPIDPKTILPE